MNHPSEFKEASSHLTLHAARFMREQSLVMRNTNTAQLSSLHYQGHHSRDSHGVGGIYSVPLWTIAIPGITQRGIRPDEIHEKVTRYKAQQLKLTPKCPSVDNPYPLDAVFIDTLAPDLAFADLKQQEKHLDEFLVAMKAFIQPYTVFSSNCNGYHYELLVGSLLRRSEGLDSTPYLDDLGRYSTGGRCPDNPLFSGNIVYRITLNAFEINFFKSILHRQYDTAIFSNTLTPANEQVASTVRYMLCNHLATEIISRKLVLFLNAGGKLKQPICLSRTHLSDLWEQVQQSQQGKITEIIQHSYILLPLFDPFSDKTYPVSSDAGAADPAKYISLQRYSTPIYKKFPNHQCSIDFLRTMFLDLTYVTHQQAADSIAHTNANALLDKIANLCQQEVFDEKNMAILVISHHRFKARLNIGTLENTTPLTPIRNANTSLTWQILNIFLIVVGTLAILLAWAALSLSTLNPLGLIVATCGTFSIGLGGYGFFRSRIPERDDREVTPSPATKI